MSVRQSNASSATTTMVPNAAAPAPMVDVTEASQETALAEGNRFIWFELLLVYPFVIFLFY